MPMEESSRRSFQTMVVGALGALITATLALPAAAYLLMKPKSKKEGDWVDVGDLTQLPPGKPEEVVFRRTRVDGWRVLNEKTTAWVVRVDDKNVVAFTPQCTHLGCAYHWDDPQKVFVCPCHASSFSLDGKVLSGPAPRPLDRYVTRIEGTKVLIGSEIKRV